MNAGTSRLTRNPIRNAAEMRRACAHCGGDVPATSHRCPGCHHSIRGLSGMGRVSCRTLYARARERAGLVSHVVALVAAASLLAVWASGRDAATWTTADGVIAAAWSAGALAYAAFVGVRWRRTAH